MKVLKPRPDKVRLAVYVLMTRKLKVAERRQDGALSPPSLRQYVVAMKRKGGFGDGFYSLPAGHVDLGENIITAGVREVEEECNVKIDPQSLAMVGCLHRTSGSVSYVDFFCSTTEWDGDITNMEPSKCSDIMVAPLPEPSPSSLFPIEHDCERDIEGTPSWQHTLDNIENIRAAISIDHFNHTVDIIQDPTLTTGRYLPHVAYALQRFVTLPRGEAFFRDYHPIS